MREDPYAPRGVKSDIPVRKTEPKVVRYNGLERDEEGVYAMYSDYEALAARVRELEEYVEHLKGEIRDLVELEGLP